MRFVMSINFLPLFRDNSVAKSTQNGKLKEMENLGFEGEEILAQTAYYVKERDNDNGEH